MAATATGGASDSVTQVNNPALPNTLLLADQPAAGQGFTWVSPYQDFAAPGLDVRQIQVAIDPLGPGSSAATDHWAALVFGTTPGSFIIGKGTGVLVRDSGQYAVFDSGKMVGSGNVGAKATPQQLYTIDFSILDPSTGQYALAINAKTLFKGTHGQYTTDYITLEDLTNASGTGTQFDYFSNLTISTDHLFQDTFVTDPNSTGGWNDVNHANGGPRQDGLFAPLTYLESSATAAGGAYDSLTQVNNPALPNTLLLATDPADGQNFTYVAANQDFGGADLTVSNIQVAIDPLGPGSSPSTDHWAAVVFGTTAGSSLSDGGTGVLVRDSGDYALWDGGTMVSSGNVGAKATPQQFYTIDFSILDPSSGQYALSINGKMLFTGIHGSYTTDYVTLEDYTQPSDTGTQMDYFQDLTIDGEAMARTNTTFYVSPQGNDNNSGTSPDSAWQTIQQVNRFSFRAGDQILFQGGATFSGNLTFGFGDGGAPNHPITVGSFGTGPATIAAGSGSAISVADAEYLSITNLVIVGSGFSTNTSDGISFTNDLSQVTMGPVGLAGIDVDHVDVSGFGKSGIHTVGPFFGVSVTYSTGHDNGEGGVAVDAYGPAADFYIGHVQAYHNAGDNTTHSGYGIFIIGASDVVVERSVAHDNGWLPGNGRETGGIEAIGDQRVVLQYNEAYANYHGASDGDGVILDDTTDSIMQFNYTHDNDGGGLFLGAEIGQVTTNNVVRYNVSENDARFQGAPGSGVYGGILVWDELMNADFYGNTVYMGPSPTGSPVAVEVIELSGTSVHLRNNIFITTGGVPLIAYNGGGTDLLFQGNDYWSSGSTFQILWAGTAYLSLDGLNGWRAKTGQEMLNGAPMGFQVDPQLNHPGGGGILGNADALSTLAAYQMMKTSPLAHAGLDLSQFSIAWDPYSFAGDAFLSAYFDPTPTDFYGDPLPAAGSSLFSIGADQLT